MLKTTPFHARTAVLNQTMLWDHWAGYAAATKYQFSEKVEYYAIRNAVALFDTSPLFKYCFQDPDAERFLIGVLAQHNVVNDLCDSHHLLLLHQQWDVIDLSCLHGHFAHKIEVYPYFAVKVQVLSNSCWIEFRFCPKI